MIRNCVTLSDQFVHRLRQQVADMERVFAAGDTEELAELAHWLKGAGGSLGFDLFSAPARTMEQSARDGDVQRMDASLAEIVRLTRRVRGPHEMASDGQPTHGEPAESTGHADTVII